MGAEDSVNKLIPIDPEGCHLHWQVGVLSLCQRLSKHVTAVADTFTTPWKSPHFFPPVFYSNKLMHKGDLHKALQGVSGKSGLQAQQCCFQTLVS